MRNTVGYLNRKLGTYYLFFAPSTPYTFLYLTPLRKFSYCPKVTDEGDI